MWPIISTRDQQDAGRESCNHVHGEEAGTNVAHRDGLRVLDVLVVENNRGTEEHDNITHVDKIEEYIENLQCQARFFTEADLQRNRYADDKSHRDDERIPEGLEAVVWEENRKTREQVRYRSGNLRKQRATLSLLLELIEDFFLLLAPRQRILCNGSYASDCSHTL